MDEIQELEDDIRHDWWTVVGFWHESWERWAGLYDAPTPRMAEDMAQMEARTRGLNLFVVAVIEGEVEFADDYATYVDPDCMTIDEMRAKLESMGYLHKPHGF